uniref:Cyclotide n=1 Tax=Viola tricolor TaxID=214053 RepID=A0A0N9YQG6_9ROSI|nr:cyclotide precursor [Viola tricolor]
MEMKSMIVGFVLIAAFALPALAAFEKDVITPRAVRMILEKVSPNSNMNMLDEKVISALTSKTLISNPLVEEALLKQHNTLGGSIPCGESCVWIPCISGIAGCSCSNKVCYLNSLAN